MAKDLVCLMKKDNFPTLLDMDIAQQLFYYWISIFQMGKNVEGSPEGVDGHKNRVRHFGGLV
jgi:hypothetical protein